MRPADHGGSSACRNHIVPEHRQVGRFEGGPHHGQAIRMRMRGSELAVSFRPDAGGQRRRESDHAWMGGAGERPPPCRDHIDSTFDSWGDRHSRIFFETDHEEHGGPMSKPVHVLENIIFA